VQPGEQFNGAISFINTGKAAGSEEVSWDDTAHVLTFDINASTTANALAAKVAADPTVSLLFTVAPTATDPGNAPAPLANGGAGPIGLAPATLVPGVGLPPWVRFGATVLPHAQIKSLSYTPQQTINGTVQAPGGVLVIGTFGRGTWKLSNVNAVIAAESTLEVT